MRVLWNCIVTGFSLAFFASCANSDNTGLSSNDAHRILESAKSKNDTLKFWDFRKPGSGLFLTGVYKNLHQARISSYTRNSQGKWIAEHSFILSDVEEFHKMEWASVNRQIYLCLDYTAADSTGRTQKAAKIKSVFLLYQPFTGKVLRLEYEYGPNRNTLYGDFIQKELDTLTQHPVELAFLQKRAGLSGLIPAEDKKNTRPGVDSALKKWAMLNEGVYDALKDKTIKTVQLNIEEYSSDISPGPQEFDNDTLVFKRSTLVSQNRRYKAVSEVKGPVYIFDKATGKSFILWAPPESKSWIHKMAFRSADLLTIYPYAADSIRQGISVYELNIAQKTIRPVVQRVPVKLTRRIKVQPRRSGKGSPGHRRERIKARRKHAVKHPEKQSKRRAAKHAKNHSRKHS